MARKPIVREIPPASVLLQDFPGFDEKCCKRSALTKQLKKLAFKLQQVDSIPFYSMREVANQFQAPLRMVAQAYEELEKEGILNRMRSSKTMLIGKRISPRKHVRAVVGVPLWLHAIVVSPYSRAFHVELEDRLRQNGFVADIIFFNSHEVGHPDFAGRLIEHQLDYIIWHTPHPNANDTLLTMNDHGIRQVLIQPTESQLLLDLPTFLQDWGAAYHEMGAAWYAHGIRKVLVPEPVYLPSQRAENQFSNIMESQGLRVEFVQPSVGKIYEQLKNIDQGRAGVAFLDQQGAELLCTEEPVILEKILKHSRVALCRGPFRVPYFNHRDAKVDLVSFSAKTIAAKVASELRESMTIGKRVLDTFKPDFHQDVPLRENDQYL
jgi:hypothetical protein